MICVRDIAFASTSAVDLLPFHGRCHIFYTPSNGTIVGLSKLARLVRLMSRRIVCQDELTWALAGAVQRQVAPQGLAVLMESTHLGAWPGDSERTTWACLGSFVDDSETKMVRASKWQLAAVRAIKRNCSVLLMFCPIDRNEWRCSVEDQGFIGRGWAAATGQLHSSCCS